MSDGISVVFSSKNDANANSGFIEHIRETSGCDVDVCFVHNPNGVSLSKVYAEMLTSNDVKCDIVVFIHDDIEFLKDGWGKEVIRLFKENKKYGIIGVAGSAYFDEGGAWWNYDDKYGQVLHRHGGKSWLTAFSPLLDKDLQEVVVIDGLFMAVHRKRVTENFCRELLGFDMYDICMCITNFLQKKIKIGVTTNIRLAHNSIGELKPSWYENRDYINKRFGKYFPLKVGK